MVREEQLHEPLDGLIFAEAAFDKGWDLPSLLSDLVHREGGAQKLPMPLPMGEAPRTSMRIATLTAG